MAAVTREQLHALVDDLTEDRLEAARGALERLRPDDGAVSARVARRLRDEGSLVSEPSPVTAEQRRRLLDRPFWTLRGEPVAETVVKNRDPVA